MAMFSKRHYEVVARAIKESKAAWNGDEDEEAALCAINGLQYKILCIFNSDNPRFDAERFNKACEPKEGGQ